VFTGVFCERNESGEIAADIGFLLRSRPPFDATLGPRPFNRLILRTVLL
jgi:hypothetical protein